MARRNAKKWALAIKMMRMSAATGRAVDPAKRRLECSPVPLCVRRPVQKNGCSTTPKMHKCPRVGCKKWALAVKMARIASHTDRAGRAAKQ